MSAPTLPTTCAAYTGSTKIDLNKNKVTFSATTTATVGWLNAADCKTDLDALLASRKAAYVVSGWWEKFLAAPYNFKTNWFDGTYSDGQVLYSTLTCPLGATTTQMLCISQSGATTNSCWIGNSND